MNSLPPRKVAASVGGGVTRVCRLGSMVICLPEGRGEASKTRGKKPFTTRVRTCPHEP